MMLSRQVHACGFDLGVGRGRFVAHTPQAVLRTLLVQEVPHVAIELFFHDAADLDPFLAHPDLYGRARVPEERGVPASLHREVRVC